MAESHHVSVLDHFADLDDPRVERTRRHKLVDIIAIAICAIICGADSWLGFTQFKRRRQGNLGCSFRSRWPQHLGLRELVPSPGWAMRQGRANDRASAPECRGQRPTVRNLPQHASHRWRRRVAIHHRPGDDLRDIRSGQGGGGRARWATMLMAGCAIPEGDGGAGAPGQVRRQRFTPTPSSPPAAGWMSYPPSGLRAPMGPDGKSDAVSATRWAARVVQALPNLNYGVSISPRAASQPGAWQWRCSRHSLAARGGRSGRADRLEIP